MHAYLEEGVDACLLQRLQRVGLHFALGVQLVPDYEDLRVRLVIILRLGQPVVLEALRGEGTTSKLS
jgi:hypothetical protein